MLRLLFGFTLIGAGGAALGYGANGIMRKLGLCTGEPGLNPEELCGGGADVNYEIMAFAFGGIAIALAGAAVLAGSRVGARPAPLSGAAAGMLAWVGLTLGVAVAGFWLEFGPDSIRDYSGGLVAGIGFGLMSLIPLALLLLIDEAPGRLGRSGPGPALGPTASLLALPALAAGAFVAIAFGNEVAPVLGHEGEAVVRGDDPGSTFRADALREAIRDAEADIAPGEVVHSARIGVDELRVQSRAPSSAFPGRLPLAQLPVGAPERMIGSLNELREASGADAITLDEVWWMTWRPSEPTESEWDVVLDGNVTEPRRFLVSRDGSSARLWSEP